MKTALITGSAGLVGSEAARFFAAKGYQIVGVDNDMRKYFFGEEASTAWNKDRLTSELKDKYVHYDIDIRDEAKVEKVFRKHHFDIVIHTAAQPSHDWAAKEPLTDFDVNARGTLIMLENYRRFSPEATFIFTSTNKVYGDNPNSLPLVELETRYEIEPSHQYKNGIDESMSLDQTTHSVFGASKVAADVMVQEYGRYFKLNTGVFRGGCLTGPQHSGTQLHGFLAYLVKCILEGKKYTIFGYKGKQVRDNIHAHDLINMFWHFHQRPHPGEAYNAGGGRHSNISMLEAIEKIEKLTGKKALTEYSDTNRVGDHIWYVSDLAKFEKHYPEWRQEYNIDRILKNICARYLPPIEEGMEWWLKENK
ncbi:MAG: NAD-dependent epimerase/dehydratase family protein [Patescibacteria group bacterium]|nr:NAD-dependent epimerase/dehydratase family protein [Patescibacteria group bacterium]